MTIVSKKHLLSNKKEDEQMKELTKDYLKLFAKQVLLELGNILSEAELFAGDFRRPVVGRQKFLLSIKYQNQKENYNKALKELKRRKLIETYSARSREQAGIKITDKGVTQIVSNEKYIREIKRPEVWDSKWRIIAFDVAEEKRMWRNLLRSMLKRMGFEQIQKSLYIHPFDCRKEIEWLKKYNKINQELIYFEASKVENERKLLKIFRDKEILY